MEEKKIERAPMSIKEFKDYLKKNAPKLNLTTYDGVGKFKSVGRAIKRQHLTSNGMLIPKRPFSNGANSSERVGVHSMKMNELKKRIYEQLRQYRGKEL